MQIPIIYETDDYLVVNKPVGVVVNRAESISGATVQDWVESRSWMVDGRSACRTSRSSIADKVFNDRSGICHRLDKETSGCLLVAKNPQTLKYFLGLFKDRKIQKSYVALVHGLVEPKEGEVVLPMKRSIFEREKWHVHYDGKKAITAWRVERVYMFKSDNERWKNKVSLLRVDLKTGRTHQIRVHFSFLGWPLFSDDKYLQKKQAVVDREYLHRHFLHAKYLSFVDNLGKAVNLEANLPDDCQELLNALEEVN